MIEFWILNLVIYGLVASLAILGGRELVEKMQLGPRAAAVLLAVGAAVFAPALASLGHAVILVPFVLFPRFYVYGRMLLPWNIGASALTVFIAMIVYYTRLNSESRRSAR